MTALPELGAPDLAFVIPGAPRPKGSWLPFVPNSKPWATPPRDRHGRIIVKLKSSTEKEDKAYAKLVGLAARSSMARRGVAIAPAGTPVVLGVTFYLKRPMSDWGTGRNAGQVKPSAPRFPPKKPDVDKLLRALMDGMSEVVYADDNQVLGGPIWKLYEEAPGRSRVEVRVWHLSLTDADHAPTSRYDGDSSPGV